MEFKIRGAKAQDLQTVQKLNRRLFFHDFKSDPGLFCDWPYSEEGEKYFQETIRGKKYLCLVAVVGRRIVGYLIGKVRERREHRPVKTAELENMLILERYRGQGIGNALVKKFVEWCKRRAVRSIVVWAYSGNRKALEFYQKNSFKPLSVRFELKP